MYESNGPDVKIRGTASHVAEKYLQLARDAQSSGDPVAAENYYQHAEHYFRLIAAAQEQFRQSQPYYQQQSGPPGNVADEAYDDGDGEQPSISGEPFAPREPTHQQPPQHMQPRPQNFQPAAEQDVDRLPSFITGQPQQQPQQSQDGGPSGPNGPNGPNNPDGPNGYDGSDRFPLHRRRRRHRGPRDHSTQGGGEGDAPMPPSDPQPNED